LGESLPVDEPVARGPQRVVSVASVCAAFGLLTRNSSAVAALSAVYLLGVPGFFRSIEHESVRVRQAPSHEVYAHEKA
jgi:hypothetical protein